MEMEEGVEIQLRDLRQLKFAATRTKRWNAFFLC